MANDILVKRIYKEWIKFKKYRSNDQTVSIQFIQFLNDKKILDRKISFNEKNDFECSLNSDDLGINVNFCDNLIVPGTALYKCADLFVAEIVRIGEINNESHSVVKECIEKKSVQIQNMDLVEYLKTNGIEDNDKLYVKCAEAEVLLAILASDPSTESLREGLKINFSKLTGKETTDKDNEFIDNCTFTFMQQSFDLFDTIKNNGIKNASSKYKFNYLRLLWFFTFLVKNYNVVTRD